MMIITVSDLYKISYNPLLPIIAIEWIPIYQDSCSYCLLFLTQHNTQRARRISVTYAQCHIKWHSERLC